MATMFDPILDQGGLDFGTFSGFGGNSPIAALYGGGSPAPAFSNPLAGLYQNYTPAPMSSYPAMPTIQFQLPAPAGVGGYGSSLGSYSPFAGLGTQFAQPLGQSFGLGQQGYGGAGGGLSALQGYNGGQQSFGGFPGFGGGQQSLGGGAAQMPGYSPGAQRSRMQSGAGQMPQGIGTGTMGGYGGQPGGYSGGTSNPANLGGGGGEFASPLPPGGVYGTQKWAPGNGIDVFVRRGTPVFAPFDGTVGPNPNAIPSPMGPVPSFVLRGNNGMAFQATHAQMTAQGPVKRGQQIGVVNDPGLDILGPYQGMPDGFQHLDITIGHGGGPFPLQGGDVNAAQWLRQIGYQGQQIPGQTRGPNGGGGPGMGFGGPPGMGLGGFPGMSPGGFPGMQGNPFMAMMGQGMGQSGFNPAAMYGQSGLGGLGQGGFGQSGFPSMSGFSGLGF